MFADADYPSVPYPGRRPKDSYVHDDATGWPLHRDPAALSGWRLPDGTELDDWLTERDAEPLAERVPLLAYGSNVCPSKITWLREALALPGPVVVLKARCTGLAAVWAAGLRVVDDQRPATLTRAPGVTEYHAVWLATVAQVEVLDRCEGRGERYRLARVDTGEVRLVDGTRIAAPLAYTALAERRLPLLVDGEPVRCADVPQAGAAALTGVPGPNGLSVRELSGAPEPAEFPDRLFVYGTLQPEASAWWRLSPLVTGAPTPAKLPGTLYDTGRGYPGLRLGDGPGVSGWVVHMGDPRTALSIMDEYEGVEYRRVRVSLPGGEECWTYVWTDPFDGLRPLNEPWRD